jgi:hypothetical protein
MQSTPEVMKRVFCWFFFLGGGSELFFMHDMTKKIEINFTETIASGLSIRQEDTNFVRVIHGSRREMSSHKHV